jgi:hypothetical protein
MCQPSGKVPMAFYEPSSAVGTSYDPFNESFQKLRHQKIAWQRRYYPSVVLAGLAYPVAIALLLILIPGSFSSSSLTGSNGPIWLNALLILLYFFASFFVASLLSTRAAKLRLPNEHKGFLDVYLAKKDVEDYAQHPDETRKLTDARIRLRRVVLLIPYGKKNSLLASSALKGTSELRGFISKRLIPYLTPPFDTSKAIHSLGYIAEYLLSPTMEGLPRIMRFLNAYLPESALPPRKAFGSESLKSIKILLGKAYLRMTWITDAFIAFIISTAIYLVAVYGLGGVPGQSFLGASASFLVAFFGIHVLRKETNPGD